MIKKLLPLFLLALMLFPFSAPEIGAGGLPPILSPAPEEAEETESAEEIAAPEAEEIIPEETYEIDIEEFLLPEQTHEEEPRESSGAWIPIAFIAAFAAALILLRMSRRGA